MQTSNINSTQFIGDVHLKFTFWLNQDAHNFVLLTFSMLAEGFPQILFKVTLKIYRNSTFHLKLGWNKIEPFVKKFYWKGLSFSSLRLESHQLFEIHLKCHKNVKFGHTASQFVLFKCKIRYFWRSMYGYKGACITTLENC